jgi:hypothetical protein
LLNRAAPAFFRMIKDILWNDTLLHIARLTDSPKRGHLTIQKLPKVVDDLATRKTVEALVKAAVNKCDFCRKPRNYVIAHTNLDLIINETNLELGSRKQVNDALISIENVLNKSIISTRAQRFILQALLAQRMQYRFCMSLMMGSKHR